MKQCPVCKTTYTDDSLRFCLTDGAGLFSMPEPAETVQVSPSRNPVQIDIPQESVPTFVAPKSARQSSGSKTGLIVASVLGGLLFLVVAAAAGGYFLLKSSNETANSSVSLNSPENASNANRLFETTNSAAPDDGTDELKEKIAELEKQIREQKKQQNETPSQPPPQDQTTYARVNSPNDGFLALRSEPDHKRGDRLAKIPHGANIQILGCQDNAATIAGRRGRWCRVSYAGQYGWAFDAWMNY